ncbi:TolA-binding protein [Desulfobaculum xiamenense]|uniref:TolA-binding protein n=1 Tax=Desulfobaculum xiamenense TaxID=995050 RepID=A0A846QIU6_9BACT|nr:tetratricopeptide repeat protein [Desulfobaculum xiamenense]NJB67000.1 TolA-binding protein [Desulfobaculum xiamenense]
MVIARSDDVNARTTRRPSCILILLSLFWLLLPSDGGAVSYTFGLHPDRERLVFTFPGTLPKYDVARTGGREFSVSIPAGMGGVSGPRPDFGGAALIRDVRVAPSGADVRMGTDAFGYVAFTLENPSRLVIDVFRDPLGARWRPNGTTPRPRAEAPAPTPVAKPEPAAHKAAATDRGAAPVTQSTPEVQTPPAATARQADIPPVAPASQPTPAAPVVSRTDGHVVSGKVARPGATGSDAGESAPAPARQDEAPAQTAPRQSQPEPPSATANVFRGKVVRGGEVPEARESVPLAEPVAPAPAAPVAQVPAAPAQAPAPEAVSKPMGEDNASRVTQDVADFIREESGPWVYRARLGKDGAPQPPTAEVPAPRVAEEAPVAPRTPDLPQPLVEAEPANATEEVAAEEAEQAPAEGTNATTPDFDEVMLAAQTAQSTGEHDVALEHLDILTRDSRVPAELKEEALYLKADILYSKYSGEFDKHFDEINGAYEAAMNFNLDSKRVPAALLKRGVLNLHVENVPEATAFFNLLRNRHKNDPNVPLTYYYWGDYHFKKKDYQRAADEFQYLVQVYPDSPFVREASLGLARSLRELGYDKQAFQIVDFIEKRWPRYYIEFPPFLQLQGDAAFSVKNYQAAKDYYWAYYNIDPQGDDADVILARLGDIYVNTDKPAAAREVYEKAIAEFPDREGGLVSKMRLAEEGIYDEPSVEQMFTIFDRPLNLKPSQIYQEIIADYPDSELAPLAQLKLGIWQLWNKKYFDAIAASRDFATRYPDSPLLPRARDVGLQAFSMVVEPLVREENYPMILKLWKDYDFLRDSLEELSPGARMALALSFWKRGEPAQALDIVTPFLRQPQIPDVSEMAMSLALSVYLENQAWDKVLDVSQAVRNWELSPDHRRELRYAQALAYENLGDFEHSRPLWAELGMDTQLDERQHAYALYFMALGAMDSNQLKQAYDYAQEALETFLRTGEDKGKIRDSLRMLMDVTERTGRAGEALKWAAEYEKNIDSSDPSWPALRYRMAGLHKKLGDLVEWRKILEALSQAMPGSLYGRMAASDLQLDSLEQATRPYQPDARMQ